jgi:hypothetical protein
MTRGGQNSLAELGMRIVWRGDDDELRLGISQGFVDVGVGLHVFAKMLHGLSTDLGITGDNSMEPQTALAANQRAVKRSPGKAVADNNRRYHLARTSIRWLVEEPLRSARKHRPNDSHGPFRRNSRRLCPENWPVDRAIGRFDPSGLV